MWHVSFTFLYESVKMGMINQCAECQIPVFLFHCFFPIHNFPLFFSVLLVLHFNEYRNINTEINLSKFMFLSYLITIDA